MCSRPRSRRRTSYSLQPRKTISNRYTQLPQTRLCGRNTLSEIDSSAGSLVFFNAVLLNSLGCYSILEKPSQCIIGSTRFYGLDAEAASIRIGFPFLARFLWDTGANAEIKGALLALSFNYFDTVFLILVQKTVDQLPQ